MEFFLNELSLHGQFEGFEGLEESLREVLKCQKEIEKNKHRLYCTKSIAVRKVFGETVFKTALAMNAKKEFTSGIMNWLAKRGPFWDDDSLHTGDDYIEYEDELITESSLAEAAFRKIQGIENHVLSFTPSNFLKTPLEVTSIKSGNERTEVNIENFWDSSILSDHLQQSRKGAENWEEVIERCQDEFKNLTMAKDDLTAILKREPFVPALVNKVYERLQVLNELKSSYNKDGTLNERGLELREIYFEGEAPYFTDESETKKSKFKSQLTFPVPGNPDETIFCPFHGKIKTNQYRIHFNWPMSLTEPLYIVYIGPKITKA